MEIKCVTSRARQNSFSQPTHITKRQHTLKSAEGRTASAAARAAAECRRGRRRGWQWTGQQQGRWHKSGGEGGAGEPLSTRLFLRSATSTVRRAREASTVRRARGRRRRGRRRRWQWTGRRREGGGGKGGGEGGVREPCRHHEDHRRRTARLRCRGGSRPQGSGAGMCPHRRARSWRTAPAP